MQARKMTVKSMCLNIACAAAVCIGLTACTSNADQEVVPAPQPQPQDYSAYESYGLTYHHFDQSDDVNRNFD